MFLTDRDIETLKMIGRFRWLTGKQIKRLVSFSSSRTADRRLKALLDSGYLTRQKILYGIAGIYTLTHKGRILAGFNKRPDTVRIENIRHDMLVLDSVIYFMDKYQLTASDILTEKELHQQNGFGNRHHVPDFAFTYQGESYAIEIELSEKTFDRLEKNIEQNYHHYDHQIWIIEKENTKIQKNIDKCRNHYPNTIIQYTNEVMTDK